MDPEAQHGAAAHSEADWRIAAAPPAQVGCSMVTHDAHAQPGHLHDVYSVVCSQGHVAVGTVPCCQYAVHACICVCHLVPLLGPVLFLPNLPSYERLARLTSVIVWASAMSSS